MVFLYHRFSPYRRWVCNVTSAIDGEITVHIHISMSLMCKNAATVVRKNSLKRQVEETLKGKPSTSV